MTGSPVSAGTSSASIAAASSYALPVLPPTLHMTTSPTTGANSTSVHYPSIPRLPTSVSSSPPHHPTNASHSILSSMLQAEELKLAAHQAATVAVLSSPANGNSSLSSSPPLSSPSVSTKSEEDSRKRKRSSANGYETNADPSTVTKSESATSISDLHPTSNDSAVHGESAEPPEKKFKHSADSASIPSMSSVPPSSKTDRPSSPHTASLICDEDSELDLSPSPAPLTADVIESGVANHVHDGIDPTGRSLTTVPTTAHSDPPASSPSVGSPDSLLFHQQSKSVLRNFADLMQKLVNVASRTGQQTSQQQSDKLEQTTNETAQQEQSITTRTAAQQQTESDSNQKQS